MKLAIIGAGGAGLCAAKHCLSQKLDFVLFEQTGNVGGTWNYTDLTGLDENGIPIHSSMYQNLRTNLPKELMSLEDFPYPDEIPSYINQKEVINYLIDYSKYFRILPHIKFYQKVLKIEPTDQEKWIVEIEDVVSKNREVTLFDSVLVCNGHNTEPFMPDIPGKETFLGRISHSHNYRSPEIYKDKKVLVIGAGPSGTDIAEQLSTVSHKVFLSHKPKIFKKMLKEIQLKPLTFGLAGRIVVFEDGSTEEIDEILLCTGYVYSFPFLTSKSGITISTNKIYPLYKHIINIKHPSMGFIGIPTTVCPFPIFDIQVRFFLASFTKHFHLPSKEKMLEDLHQDISNRILKHCLKYHHFAEAQGDYFEDLATTAKIPKVPPVLNKLYIRVRANRNLEDCFRIIDDDNWEQIR